MSDDELLLAVFKRLLMDEDVYSSVGIAVDPYLLVDGDIAVSHEERGALVRFRSGHPCFPPTAC